MNYVVRGFYQPLYSLLIKMVYLSEKRDNLRSPEIDALLPKREPRSSGTSTQTSHPGSRAHTGETPYWVRRPRRDSGHAERPGRPHAPVAVPSLTSTRRPG